MGLEWELQFITQFKQVLKYKNIILYVMFYSFQMYCELYILINFQGVFPLPPT